MVKKSGEEPDPNPPSERSVDAYALRSKFSMEEIQKLLGDIDGLISTQKALEHGIDPKNMVKTVRGGKTIWITVQEMNAVLDKRRRLSGEKFKKRTLRGDDSLSSEINRRVEACRLLINILRDVAPKESTELTQSLRDLESLHNQSLSHAHELRLIETAIERKKQEDPLHREMDQAVAEMVEAVDKNQLKDADVCQSFCDRHMEEYLIKQRRLKPYLKRAKESRFSFVQAKQQLYVFEFQLIQKGENLLSYYLEEIIYYDKAGSDSHALVQGIEKLRAHYPEGQPFFYRLSATPVAELEDRQDLFHDADQKYLSPMFEIITQVVHQFKQAWEKYVVLRGDATRAPGEGAPVLPKRRMVFQEKKDNS